MLNLESPRKTPLPPQSRHDLLGRASCRAIGILLGRLCVEVNGSPLEFLCDDSWGRRLEKYDALIASAVYVYGLNYQTIFASEQIVKTQHLIAKEKDAIARLRAIEAGRTVVNISTVGTSAIIAPDGTRHYWVLYDK